MKMIYATVSIIGLSFASANSFAIPLAPRAVVVQTMAVNGKFDEVGREKALQLAITHLKSKSAEAIVQRLKMQAPDMAYLCIEYATNADAYNIGFFEFQKALVLHTTMEIAMNTECK